ncbi:Adenylyl-sulfate kinase, partial [Zea mays]
RLPAATKPHQAPHCPWTHASRGSRVPVRLPFAASTATRRAGWRCSRDPRVDSSGGGAIPSPGRCPRLAVAHRNRSPAANLGLPPPRPLLPRLLAAGIRTRVTGDRGCEGRPLVECAGDRSVEEQPEHAGG